MLMVVVDNRSRVAPFSAGLAFSILALIPRQINAMNKFENMNALPRTKAFPAKSFRFPAKSTPMNKFKNMNALPPRRSPPNQRIPRQTFSPPNFGRDDPLGCSGSVRNPFGVRSGSARGPFRVRSGSVLDPFGVRSGSVRGRKPAAAKKTAVPIGG